MQGIQEEIAARVRELRECCDLTPADLASKINVPLTEYQAMEAGQSDFPVSVLNEIAEALNTDLVALLTGRNANMRSFCVTRAGAGVEVKRRADYGYRSLAENFVGKKCIPLYVTVPVDAQKPHLNSHEGQEFNYVLSGTMKIYLHDQEIVLNPGDCIYFDAAQEHAMRALGDEPAKLLVIVL